MNKNILILGKGFIGTRLQKALNCRISGKMMYSFSDVEKEIKKHKPKVVINCIGYTGARNVDDCEKDKDLTLSANSFMPVMIAESCLRNKIKMVHISSGCIFHYDYKKDKPIKEDKIPDFFELFYSRSKMYSERALDILAKKYNILTVRIRIPLDNNNHPRNILSKLLRYRKNVIDIPNSVTYIPDFIKALKHLIKKDARGIYNIVNKGGLRYPQLLDVYKKYDPKFDYKVLSIKKFPLTRTNLVLSTKKLEKSGFKVRHIKDILDECVKGYLKS